MALTIMRYAWSRSFTRGGTITDRFERAAQDKGIASRNRLAAARHPSGVRPASLDCSACGKRHEVRLANVCDCGGPLLPRHEWEDLPPRGLVSPGGQWRDGPPFP